MSRSVTDIQADLDAAYAARRAALAGPEEYSIDSGQGRQSARRSLPNINATIRALEAEILDASDSGNSGPVEFKRG